MKKTKYTIECVYLGEKVNVMGVIRQVFRDKKKEEHHYNGIKGVWFGDAVLITKDHKIGIRPERPKNQTVFATDQERLDYEANKEIVKDYRLRKRKELEIKKPHQDIVTALNLLRPFTRNMDSVNLKRFTNYIENQLSRKKR